MYFVLHSGSKEISSTYHFPTALTTAEGISDPALSVSSDCTFAILIQLVQ